MEAVVLVGLLGAGYLLNKDDKKILLQIMLIKKQVFQVWIILMNQIIIIIQINLLDN